MKSKMSIALTAFVFTLVLAAAPHRASAATDIFLQLDGVPGESTEVAGVPQWIHVIANILGF